MGIYYTADIGWGIHVTNEEVIKVVEEGYQQGIISLEARDRFGEGEIHLEELLPSLLPEGTLNAISWSEDFYTDEGGLFIFHDGTSMSVDYLECQTMKNYGDRPHDTVTHIMQPLYDLFGKKQELKIFLTAG